MKHNCKNLGKENKHSWQTIIVEIYFYTYKGVSFYGNCGVGSVGTGNEYLVLSAEVILPP